MDNAKPPESQTTSSHKSLWSVLTAALLFLALFGAKAIWFSDNADMPLANLGGNPILPLKVSVAQGMILLPGGTYQRGSDASSHPDRSPSRRIEISPFWLDQTLVTNRQFAQFVRDTSYRTTAEQLGRSQVFERPTGQWKRVSGANWQTPSGPQSSIAGREDYPVVQISYFDAAAFADWAEKRLPTEAEWEYAARGGLVEAIYPWGSDETSQGSYHANYWQGWFPDEDRSLDQYRGVSPVRAFTPNQFGLYDMAGNTWQWCADWYAEDAYSLSTAKDPLGPNAGVFRVRRGGSWLSAKNSTDAIRLDARGYVAPAAATNDQGFRCARSSRPESRSPKSPNAVP